MKRVIVSVTNDLTHDQRVHKVCMSLYNKGYLVTLVGRKRQDSSNLVRPYQTKRFSFIPKRGMGFYAVFNFRLFFFLIFKKVDILHSNDLDTLLANWLVHIIRRKELVYDSHEYFTGVPEIQKKPIVKKTWKFIEKLIFPRLKHVFTVNRSIADLYNKEYGVEVNVLRNFPLSTTINKEQERHDLDLPKNKKIVILQGTGINIDRGSEELLEAIALSDNLFLCIVGSGDVIEQLKIRSQSEDLYKKVIFTGKLPYEKMMQYTMNADVGVSLDKDTNLNYRFSLPNKVFDYIKAGIPVVTSNLKELEVIINKYKIGLITPSHEPKEVLKTINNAISNENNLKFKQNIKVAIKDLTWENECIELLKVYNSL